MSLRRALAVLALALGPAWAGACADADVVLEVERPPAVLGGAEFELDGDVLTFSEGACLEAGGAEMTAARIVYDRAAGVLHAEAVAGGFADWTVRAPRLVGEGDALLLEQAVFERGDAVVRAAVARFEGGRAELAAIEARTSRYRFRAASGRLEGEVFTAEKVRSTPCKCGDALELAARRATFRFEDEELVLQRSAFRLYGATLARPERLRLELDQPLDLRFPLRLGYGAGWNFGVEGLPLPAPDEAFGRWSTRLTLLAEGVGGAPGTGKTEAVRFAVEHASGGRKLRFGLRPARSWNGTAWEERVEPDVVLSDGPFAARIVWSRALGRSTAAFVVAPQLGGGAYELRPFARLADEEQRGLAAGALGRLSAGGSAGDLAFNVAAPFALAAYPDAAPYAWGGAELQVAYQDWARAKLAAYAAYGAPRYGYEARTPRRAFSLSLGREAGFSLGYDRSVRYDLSAGAVDRLREGYRARAWWKPAGRSLQADWSRDLERSPGGALLSARGLWRVAAAWRTHALALEWRRGWDGGWATTRSELWLDYRPTPPDCAGGWTLAPSLGWDLLRGRVSRAGLELTLNDCCFAWTLGYEGVFAPQLPGEAAGHQVRFGVRLR